MTATVSMGVRAIELDEAQRILAPYTDVEANRRAIKPYAHPAYDQMDVGSEPTMLTAGDLLAPQLLNVQVKLVAFYGLQRLATTLSGTTKR